MSNEALEISALEVFVLVDIVADCKDGFHFHCLVSARKYFNFMNCTTLHCCVKGPLEKMTHSLPVFTS